MALQDGRETSSSNNKYTEAGADPRIGRCGVFRAEDDVPDHSSHRPKSKTFTHPQYEFAIGTPDRQYMIPKVVGVEYSNVRQHSNAYDDIPEKCLSVTMVSRRNGFGIRFGGVARTWVGFQIPEYTYDREFFDYLMNAVATFGTIM